VAGAEGVADAVGAADAVGGGAEMTLGEGSSATRDAPGVGVPWPLEMNA